MKIDIKNNIKERPLIIIYENKVIIKNRIYISYKSYLNKSNTCDCTQCDLNKLNICKLIYCDKEERTDKTNVYFKEVINNKLNS